MGLFFSFCFDLPVLSSLFSILLILFCPFFILYLSVPSFTLGLDFHIKPIRKIGLHGFFVILFLFTIPQAISFSLFTFLQEWPSLSKEKFLKWAVDMAGNPEWIAGILCEVECKVCQGKIECQPECKECIYYTIPEVYLRCLFSN